MLLWARELSRPFLHVFFPLPSQVQQFLSLSLTQCVRDVWLTILNPTCDRINLPTKRIFMRFVLLLATSAHLTGEVYLTDSCLRDMDFSLPSCRLLSVGPDPFPFISVLHMI